MQLAENDEFLVSISGAEGAFHDPVDCRLVGKVAHSRVLTSVAVLPKNRFCVFGDEEGEILLYDVHSGEVVQHVSGH